VRRDLNLLHACNTVRTTFKILLKDDNFEIRFENKDVGSTGGAGSSGIVSDRLLYRTSEVKSVARNESDCWNEESGDSNHNGPVIHSF
jgi:hypothetical protein